MKILLLLIVFTTSFAFAEEECAKLNTTPAAGATCCPGLGQYSGSTCRPPCTPMHSTTSGAGAWCCPGSFNNIPGHENICRPPLCVDSDRNACGVSKNPFIGDPNNKKCSITYTPPPLLQGDSSTNTAAFYTNCGTCAQASQNGDIMLVAVGEDKGEPVPGWQDSNAIAMATEGLIYEGNSTSFEGTDANQHSFSVHTISSPSCTPINTIATPFQFYFQQECAAEEILQEGGKCCEGYAGEVGETCELIVQPITDFVFGPPVDKNNDLITTPDQYKFTLLSSNNFYESNQQRDFVEGEQLNKDSDNLCVPLLGTGKNTDGVPKAILRKNEFDLRRKFLMAYEYLFSESLDATGRLWILRVGVDNAKYHQTQREAIISEYKEEADRRKYDLARFLDKKKNNKIPKICPNNLKTGGEICMTDTNCCSGVCFGSNENVGTGGDDYTLKRCLPKDLTTHTALKVIMVDEMYSQHKRFANMANLYEALGSGVSTPTTLKTVDNFSITQSIKKWDDANWNPPNAKHGNKWHLKRRWWTNRCGKHRSHYDCYNRALNIKGRWYIDSPYPKIAGFTNEIIPGGTYSLQIEDFFGKLKKGFSPYAEKHSIFFSESDKMTRDSENNVEITAEKSASGATKQVAYLEQIGNAAEVIFKAYGRARTKTQYNLFSGKSSKPYYSKTSQQIFIDNMRRLMSEQAVFYHALANVAKDSQQCFYNDVELLAATPETKEGINDGDGNNSETERPEEITPLTKQLPLGVTAYCSSGSDNCSGKDLEFKDMDGNIITDPILTGEINNWKAQTANDTFVSDGKGGLSQLTGGGSSSSRGSSSSSSVSGSGGSGNNGSMKLGKSKLSKLSKASKLAKKGSGYPKIKVNTKSSTKFLKAYASDQAKLKKQLGAAAYAKMVNDRQQRAQATYASLSGSGRRGHRGKKEESKKTPQSKMTRANSAKRPQMNYSNRFKRNGRYNDYDDGNNGNSDKKSKSGKLNEREIKNMLANSKNKKYANNKGYGATLWKIITNTYVREGYKRLLFHKDKAAADDFMIPVNDL